MGMFRHAVGAGRLGTLIGSTVLVVLLAPPLVLRAHAQDEPGAAESYFYDGTGQRVCYADAERRYRLVEDTPNYLRAGLEDGLLLGAGTVWYWAESEANSADWDRPTLAQRFDFGNQRFDNNTFRSNQIFHPFAGAGYYGFARSNGLDPLWSLLYSILSSSIWEYGLEFREQVSINDQIMTPLGGFPIGETIYELMSYLSSAPGGGNALQQVLAWTLGVPVHLHRVIDERPDDDYAGRDNLGYSAHFSHRFDLRGEASRVAIDGASETTWGLSGEMRLVSLPGYLRPGHLAVPFAGGNFVHARFRLSYDQSGTVDSVLRLRATIFGFVQQDIRRTASGGLRGSALMIGAHTWFEFVRRWLPNMRDDLSIAHLIGPMVEVSLLDDELTFRFETGITGDFGGLRPVAWEQWLAEGNSTVGIKTVLANQEYYYAFGYSGWTHLTLALAGLELGIDGNFGRYGSVEGHDRLQEQVTNDVSAVDWIVELGAHLTYAPSFLPLEARVGVARIIRTGSLGSVSVEKTYDRLTVGAGLRF